MLAPVLLQPFESWCQGSKVVAGDESFYTPHGGSNNLRVRNFTYYTPPSRLTHTVIRWSDIII